MKVPYISAYVQEFPLKESAKLYYDNETQINYVDEGMNVKAINFVGPDTTVLTETVENRDEQDCYLKNDYLKRKITPNENENLKLVFGPETSIETFTHENSDRDEYLFLGPDTTTVTKTVEGSDLDSFIFGPETTIETNTVENSDADSALFDSIIIENTFDTKIVNKYKQQVFYGPETTIITRTIENSDEQ